MHESMQYLPTIGANAEVVPHLGLASRQLCTVRSGTNAEQAAIRFIQSRFLESYGARPKLQVPRLMTLMNRDCKLLALGFVMLLPNPCFWKTISISQLKMLFQIARKSLVTRLSRWLIWLDLNPASVVTCSPY